MNQTKLFEKHYCDVVFKDGRFCEEDWRSIRFESCKFENCLLDRVDLEGAKLHEVEFRDSKVIAADFYKCDQMLIDISFVNSQVLACNFSGLSLVKSVFINSVFQDCSFLENKFRGANFSGSAFPKSEFSQCDLREANFKDAKDYIIDPSINKLTKAIFSSPEVIGLLTSLDIKIIN